MPGSQSMLPTPTQLQKLSEDKVRLLVGLADKLSHRKATYAIAGLVCGTTSLLAALAGYIHLVEHNHEKAAGVVLGTTVLAVISRMIQRSK